MGKNPSVATLLRIGNATLFTWDISAKSGIALQGTYDQKILSWQMSRWLTQEKFMKRIQSSKKLSRRHGALLVDVVLGLFFFLVFALCFAALFPVIKRAQIMSMHESKAVQMTSRLVEHLQMLPSKDVNATSLIALNLIEPGQSEQPWSFSKIPLDHASQYSPDQILRDANGTITTTSLADGSVKVIVRLSYTTETGKTKNIRSGTVIGSFR